MIIQSSSVKAHGGHIRDMSRAMKNLSPHEEYIVRDKAVGHNSSPNELVISASDCSINLSFDVVHRNGVSDDGVDIKIPLFKFDGVFCSEWVDDKLLYMDIDRKYLSITYHTMLSTLKKNTFDMSTLLMVNKYIFGIHWREWIESSKHKLYVDL